MSQYTGSLARTLWFAGVATSLVACASAGPQSSRIESAPVPLSQAQLPSAAVSAENSLIRGVEGSTST